MPSTAAVIFDFFGTLTPSTPGHVWAEHAARSAAALGIEPAAWLATLHESIGDRSTGRLGDLPATIVALARRNGVEPTAAQLAAACAARRGAQRELFALRRDAIAVLTELRAHGLRLGVLSDCTIELADEWPLLPVAGLIDARVLSCEVGRRKPDPELYRLITQRLDISPGHCLYVGDGGGNELAGAAACGLRAVMLRAGDWSANEARARDARWAGPSIPSLPAVLSLVSQASG